MKACYTSLGLKDGRILKISSRRTLETNRHATVCHRGDRRRRSLVSLSLTPESIRWPRESARSLMHGNTTVLLLSALSHRESSPLSDPRSRGKALACARASRVDTRKWR